MTTTQNHTIVGLWRYYLQRSEKAFRRGSVERASFYSNAARDIERLFMAQAQEGGAR